MNPTVTMVGMGGPGVAEIIVILLVSLIPIAAVIILFRLARYISKAKKEQLLTRLELGKTADEVQKMRQELQNISSKQQNTKTQ